MTDRRKFMKSAVSAVLAVAGVGTVDNENVSEVETLGGETVHSVECDGCRRVQNFKERIDTEIIPNTEPERQTLAHAIDPKNHSWEDDCYYVQITPYLNREFDRAFSKSEVMEMDYRMEVTSKFNTVHVNVIFEPRSIQEYVDVDIAVGDSV